MTGAPVVLRSGELSTVVEPVGGTLTSLRAGDLEWLARSESGGTLSGTDFAETGYRGWDECFPSISATVIAHGSRRVSVPDHGWAWARPWTVEQQSLTAATLAIAFGELDCVFRRRVEVSSAAVRLDYQVRNYGTSALPFVWAGHGLFAGAGDLLVSGLPAPSRIESASPGTDPAQPWPAGADGRRRWSQVPAGSHAKWFARWPAAGVTLERAGRRLVMQAERRDAGPMYVGVWQNRSVEFGGSGFGHVGLEPGLGDRDDLAHAVAEGTAVVVAPHSEIGWSVTLRFG